MIIQFDENIKLIGFGHKARQGKDSAAQFMQQMHPSVQILHWANGVYEEISDVPKNEFLIFCTGDGFWLRNKPGCYVRYDVETFPKLQHIFVERGIVQYDRMVEKDPEMLQFWGTDYRRTHCGHDYWVNRTLEAIKSKVAKLNPKEKHIIAIADTRFRNEAKALREHNGVYVDVIRYHKDGERFLAPDRDPQHPSEIDLDGVRPDYTLQAFNLAELEQETKRLLYQLR